MAYGLLFRARGFPGPCGLHGGDVPSLVVLRLILPFLSAAFLSGCSGPLPAAASLERASALMNLRKYTEAIDLLEPQLRLHPDDKGTGLLLAEARLGKADFELLNIAARVFRCQSPTPREEEYGMNCEDSAIARGEDFDLKLCCIQI